MVNKRFLVALFVVGAPALITSCSQHDAPAVPPTSQVSAIHATRIPKATLTVTPTTVAGCESGKPFVAEVRWHSPVPNVTVMVNNAGQSPRLFSQGGYSGKAITGSWVVANTNFTLVDASKGVTLATASVDLSRCGH